MLEVKLQKKWSPNDSLSTTQMTQKYDALRDNLSLIQSVKNDPTIIYQQV